MEYTHTLLRIPEEFCKYALFNPFTLNKKDLKNALDSIGCLWEDWTAGGQIHYLSDTEEFKRVFRSVLNDEFSCLCVDQRSHVKFTRVYRKETLLGNQDEVALWDERDESDHDAKILADMGCFACKDRRKNMYFMPMKQFDNIFGQSLAYLKEVGANE